MGKKIKDRILAKGEATGHAHKVTIDVYEGEFPDTKEFCGATTVIHEEHKPITLSDKEWVSGQVQVMDHVENRMRNVRD